VPPRGLKKLASRWRETKVSRFQSLGRSKRPPAREWAQLGFLGGLKAGHQKKIHQSREQFVRC
jgi:hypothetical protein